jgi:hypothetical protein
MTKPLTEDDGAIKALSPDSKVSNRKLQFGTSTRFYLPSRGTWRFTVCPPFGDASPSDLRFAIETIAAFG